MSTVAQRLAVLESKEAIRSCLGRYFDLCDVPGPLRSTDELAELFTPRAIWEGLGEAYAGKFGRVVGRHKVAAHVGSYLPPSDHFKRNVHLLGSEQLHNDAEGGSGQWLMQQLSTYADGSGELLVARLRIDFQVTSQSDQPVARIRHFRTERVYRADLVST